MNIGLAIKNRRIEMGLTQEELAKKTGYKDRTMISKIEKSETDIPISKLLVIAEVLETDPNYLLGYEYKDYRSLSSGMAISDFNLVSKFSYLNTTNKKIVSDIIDVIIENQYQN